MEVIKTQPTVYPMLKESFPKIDWDKGIIITIGGKIYSKFPVDEFNMVHEMVHVKQQNKFARFRLHPIESFIHKFTTDVKFRYELELEAYRAEYQYVLSHAPEKDKEGRINHMASCFASNYNLDLSFDQAMQAITS